LQVNKIWNILQKSIHHPLNADTQSLEGFCFVPAVTMRLNLSMDYAIKNGDDRSCNAIVFSSCVDDGELVALEIISTVLGRDG
jgi:hypothetical protein